MVFPCTEPVAPVLLTEYVDRIDRLQKEGGRRLSLAAAVSLHVPRGCDTQARWTLREGCGYPPAVAPCHRNELGTQRLSLGLVAEDGAGLGEGLVLDSWTAETLTLVCRTGPGGGTLTHVWPVFLVCVTYRAR